ncbi:hypothetical protein HDZ31DRAFT_61313 [Schizophyllum fasciatum]
MPRNPEGVPTTEPDEMQLQRVSPIQDLPNEILGHVLLLACVDVDLVLPPLRRLVYPPRRHLCPALVLTSVCRLWRVVALSIQEIWTPPIKVDLRAFQSANFEDPGQEESKRLADASVAIFDCYYLRSGMAPLPHVEVQGHLRDHMLWRTPVEGFLRILFSTLSEWRSCTLSGFMAHRVGRLLLPPFPTPELLERVVISPLIDHYMDVQVLKTAPRLRSWSGPVLDIFIGHSFPWAQFEELKAQEFVAMPILQSVLPSFQNMVNLQLCVCFRDGQHFQSKGPFVLQCLEEFVLYLDTREVLASVLSTLTLPCLRRLTLSGAQVTLPGGRLQSVGALCLSSWPMSEFEGWLARSRCTLDILALRTIFMPKHALISLLEQLPSLSEFDFLEGRAWQTETIGDGPIIDTDLLCRMTVDGVTDAPPLLPHLRRWKIHARMGFGHAALVRMISSRTNPYLAHLDIFAEYGLEGMNGPMKAELLSAMGSDATVLFDSTANALRDVDFAALEASVDMDDEV